MCFYKKNNSVSPDHIRAKKQLQEKLQWLTITSTLVIWEPQTEAHFKRFVDRQIWAEEDELQRSVRKWQHGGKKPNTRPCTHLYPPTTSTKTENMQNPPTQKGGEDSVFLTVTSTLGISVRVHDLVTALDKKQENDHNLTILIKLLKVFQVT